MSWVKIDDRYAHHPKIHAAGPIAMALDIAGMCHAARHETDGHIATTALGVVAPFLSRTKALAAAAKLVEVGRWSPVSGGWQIHDFLDYNPSAAERKARRDQAVDRVRRHRDKKRDSNALTPRTRNAAPGPHPRPAEGGDGDPPKSPHPQPPSEPASPSPSQGDVSAGQTHPQPDRNLAGQGTGDPPNGAPPSAITAALDAALPDGWRHRPALETVANPAELEANRARIDAQFRAKFAQELNENETESESP